jgi:hypothetical protein
VPGADGNKAHEKRIRPIIAGIILKSLLGCVFADGRTAKNG